MHHPKYDSYKTAIKRSKPAKPLSVLASNGYIHGKTMYHGRGKDFPGENLIKEIVGKDSYVAYDPADKLPYKLMDNDSFDSIISIYVLNVLHKSERRRAIEMVANHLDASGKAYFAVRGMGDGGSKKVEQWKPFSDGYITSGNTFQTFYTTKRILKELGPYFRHLEIISGSDKSASILVSARAAIQR